MANPVLYSREFPAAVFIYNEAEFNDRGKYVQSEGFIVIYLKQQIN